MVTGIYRLTMKHILIIAFSDLENDPRVFRQISFLSREYRISTVGWEPAQVKGVNFYPLQPLKRSRLNRVKRAFLYKFHRYESLYWSLYKFQPLIDVLRSQRFDLILINDVDALPFGLKIAEITGGANVLFDTHEYAPKHFADRFSWRFFFQGFNEYLCKTYLKQCDVITTVSSGIAGEYRRNFGIQPEIITNAMAYTDLKPAPVAEDNIRIITHGVANPNRRLEICIEIMDHLDCRFHLDMMLLPVYPRYYTKLQRMAGKRANVNIVPPVKLHQIVPATNEYDLSFIIFKPTTINFRCGLFNKTFESLQARLGIVTGPAPEPQVEIVNRYKCGLVTENFDPRHIAEQLNRLNADEITGFKANSHIAASELTAEKNMEKLGTIVKRLI